MLTPVKGNNPPPSRGPATKEDQSKLPPPLAREVIRSVQNIDKVSTLLMNFIAL